MADYSCSLPSKSEPQDDTLERKSSIASFISNPKEVLLRGDGPSSGSHYECGRKSTHFNSHGYGARLMWHTYKGCRVARDINHLRYLAAYAMCLFSLTNPLGNLTPISKHLPEWIYRFTKAGIRNPDLVLMGLVSVESNSITALVDLPISTQIARAVVNLPMDDPMRAPFKATFFYYYGTDVEDALETRVYPVWNYIPLSQLYRYEDGSHLVGMVIHKRKEKEECGQKR